MKMRLVKCIVFIFLSQLAIGQTIDFSLGPNINLVYKINNTYTFQDYVNVSPGFNLSAHQFISFKNRPMKWGVNISYLQGEFDNGYGTWSTTGYLEGTYDHLNISLDFFPLAIQNKKFEFNLGLTAGYRAYTETVLISPKDGYLFPWDSEDLFNPALEYTYHKNTLYNKDKFGNKFSIGLAYEFLYVLNLKKFSIIPKISVYHGISPEYSIFQNGIFRTTFSPQIGLRKEF